MRHARPIRDYMLTPHALQKAAARGIPLDLIHEVLASPDQCSVVRPGRVVVQSRCAMHERKKDYLIRVIVDVDRKPAEVVTVYLTSRMERYWEFEP